jgi:hypothetical protein
MRSKLALFLFWLLLAANAWAGTAPNAADYVINVHVSKSCMVRGDNSALHWQKLSVVIDGKNYKLESVGAPNMLLTPSDYKARLTKDEQKKEYESLQIYEFLFPDQKTRRFVVVERTE